MALWKLVWGICVRDLGTQCYLFQFFHENDVLRIERGGPWTFDRYVLLTRRLRKNEKPLAGLMYNLSIWLQVYNLPSGFRSEKVAKAIGDYVGGFIESDPKNFDGSGKDYVRIQVYIHIHLPLKPSIELKRNGGDWFDVKFQYERLPMFCFCCGIIRHSDIFCEKTYVIEIANKDFPYGPDLRANNRKSSMVDGTR